jgi:hypothetical protein
MKNPEILHHFSDGLYAKQSCFPAGMAILKHTHDLQPFVDIGTRQGCCIAWKLRLILWKHQRVLKLKQG